MLRRIIPSPYHYTHKSLTPLLIKRYSSSQAPRLAQSISEATASEREQKSVLQKLTTDNDAYDNFLQSFPHSAMAQSQMTSVEEKKSFDEILSFLMEKKGDIGATDTLKTITMANSKFVFSEDKPTGGLKASILSSNSSFSLSTGASLLSAVDEYKQQVSQIQKLTNNLEQSLSYISNTINDSRQMTDFIQHCLFEPFAENHKAVTENGHSFKFQDSLVKSELQSLQDPSNPYVDIYTLPILLEFCLRSLTFDFDSLDESLSVLDLSKTKHPIFVYEFGFNINVYNSIIEQVWFKTENLQLVGKLIDELQVNAIQPNIMTFKLLTQIYLKIMNIKDGIKAEPYLLWGDRVHIYKVKDYLKSMKFIK